MLVGSVEVPARRVHWGQSIRIIPSRFPPVSLFERVASAADFDALHELESLTNDRLRDERGEIRVISERERVRGPGSSYIMAPFTHVNPNGSRFGDGSFGVYYAAKLRATAVAETRHHRARFMAATREPATELEMRVLEARLRAPLHDLRPLRGDLPRVHDPDDYNDSRRLGRQLWERGSWGIAYRSVRHAGGECAAVFRPRALSDCRQAEHLVYLWDGQGIVEVYEKRLYRP